MHVNVSNRYIILSSARKNIVIYSEKNWNDISSKYNLYNEVEIVIREKNNLPQQKHQANNHWVMRTALAIGVLTLLGNFPVQSNLKASANTNSSQSSANSFNDLKSSKHYTTFIDTINNPSSENIDHQPYNYTFQVNSEAQALTLPKQAIKTYAGHSPTVGNNTWRSYKVTSYDNLTNIFHKIGYKNTLKTLKENSSIIEQLSLLKKKGTIVRANSVNGALAQLVFSYDIENSFVITRNDDNTFSSFWKKNLFEVRQSRSSFTIKNGLFSDGKRSGISNDIIKQFVKVFDWDIDFSHDVRIGDKVTIVFEEVYHGGDKVTSRNLLAAEFINKDRKFRTIRYVNKEGKADYFTPQGREMKRAFIRTPIAHARVSSHFNPSRFHPKLHKIRAHKGTDFAARRGTPIMATGNGTIVSVGRKGGYGRTVVIRHRGGYTTTYAHMSRFKKKLRSGQKVYQGDVIGYVGSSGLATGPHLHYEFHKNGKAVNAMTVSLPNSMSLSRKELQDFRSKAVNLVLQLNVLHRFVEADIEIDSSIGG